MKTLIALLLLFLSATSAQAITYWVSPSLGSNGNCTNARGSTPPNFYLRTLVAGTACLSVGDTLYIRSGTYNETPNTAALPTGTSWNPGGFTRIASYSSEIVTITSNPFRTFNSTAAYVFFDGSEAGACGWVSTVCGLVFTVGSISAGGQGVHHTRWKAIDLSNGTGSTLVQPMLGDSADATQLGGNEVLNSRIHDNNGETTNDNCVYFEEPNDLVDGNEIYNCTGAGVQIYTGGAGNTNNVIVRNNVVHDVTLTTLACLSYIGGGPHCNTANNDGRLQGIILSDGTNIKVYNNIVYHLYKTRDGTCASVGGCTGGAIFTYRDVPGLQVYNNTFYDSQASAVALSNVTNGSVTVRNNIMLNNLVSVFSDSSGGFLTASNNLCDVSCGVGSTNQIQSATNAMVNPAGHDFHLKTGSLAIDNGVTGISSTDIASNPRGQGGGWDIGAYEFISGGGPPTVTIALPANCKGTASACTCTSPSCNTPITITGTSSLP